MHETERKKLKNFAQYQKPGSTIKFIAIWNWNHNYEKPDNKCSLK